MGSHKHHMGLFFRKIKKPMIYFQVVFGMSCRRRLPLVFSLLFEGDRPTPGKAGLLNAASHP